MFDGPQPPPAPMIQSTSSSDKLGSNSNLAALDNSNNSKSNKDAEASELPPVPQTRGGALFSDDDDDDDWFN